jgi:hypothetical protein
MNRLAPVSLALLLAVAPVHAAGGGGTGAGGGGTVNPGIPQERRIEEDVSGSQTIPERALPPGIQIEGTVRDSAGRPLEGVLVKLFANGLVRATAETVNNGTFSVESNPQIGGNNTSVIWFQSPTDSLLDAHAVLSAGDVAREKKLFPPCVQRVELMGNSARVDVTLMSLAERAKDLDRSGCLER